MSANRVSEALGTGVVIEAVESMTGADSIAPEWEKLRDSAADSLEP